ncbi:MAG: Hsp20/alpha crystallin family protein [Deltaproteobacteria bacterium]|jgi:HSP20 family protein
MNPEVKHEEAHPHKQESTTPQGTERIQARKVYVPQVDILETDQALLLVSDMAGVDEKGVDITVEKNILTIKGTVVSDVPAGYKLSYEEYGVGDYERSFTLPNEIDRDGIQATIKDGVLTLTLPKAKQALAKKVTVAAG